jgi:CBS domain-containing protein
MKVEELMNSAPRTCGPYDSLNRVAQIMWDDACGCVAIVDGARRPIGVLTDRDIAMAAYTRGKRLAEISVLETMARRVICCESGSSAADAEKLMRERGLRRLPVVDSSGILIGLLTRDALARAADRTVPSPELAADEAAPSAQQRERAAAVAGTALHA